MNPILRLCKSLLKKVSYDLVKKEKFNFKDHYPEASDFELKLYETCSKFTMTSHERIFSLMNSIKFINDNKVEGDFVECGVWKGGNLILFQNYIDELNLDKKIYAFDTFEGMSKPQDIDVTYKGEKSKIMLEKLAKKKVDRNENILIAECSLKNVIRNFNENCKNNNLICIKGLVEDTLKIEKNIPNKISILRLDTDWYSSTKKELEILFPLLEKNGILIIDDYGYWKGARKAVDEYFKNKNVTMFKIDFTGRMIINSR